MKNQNNKITYIQEFGSLIVLDLNLNVIGISAYVLSQLDATANTVLGGAFGSIAERLFDAAVPKIERILVGLKENLIPRQLLMIRMHGKRHYLKLSLHKKQLFIEIEEQQQRHISAAKMNEMSFLLDHIQPNNWDLVCLAINRILNFDRVLVVQIQETGYSKVIAETLNSNTSTSLKNQEFSSTLMPPEVFSYYCSYSYRYTPNLDQNGQAFYGSGKPIDLLDSHLVPIPQLHYLFLKKIGVNSAIFFPIYIENQCWGLVVAHHHAAKKIDLQKRKLCTFTIQNASSKYESYLKQNLLEHNEHLQLIEDKVKSSLSENRTINCAMVQNMDVLMKMTKADGFAIYNQGDLFFHGNCPTSAQFEEIISFLQENSTKEIFKDYNFRLKHGHHIQGVLPIAGLMSFRVGSDNDYYLTWFRIENPTKVVQIETIVPYSDASYINMWEETIYDSATPWDEIELQFISRLQQIIKEFTYNKIKEKQLLTEQLLSLNNELEMFTFTLSHDLKNPLSILKMGIQYLQKTSDRITQTNIDKWLHNLNSSVGNIEDIIHNIVQLSQNKTNMLTKDPIPMAYTLKKIVQEAVMIYETNNCEIKYGTLLPLWGEKSALYQIFSNLIGNAIKYSKHNIYPKITIDSFRTNNAICYTVKDNGIGIPEETLPHIFEMFSRAPNALQFQGSGIGLSLVKRIVERLGGSIEIRSILDQGTEIAVYFPLVEEFPQSMLQN